MHSIGEHTLRARGRCARVSGNDSDVKDAISVGGFLDLSGYQEGQFSGTRVGFVELGWFKSVRALPQPFGSGLYAGATLEAARIHEPLGMRVSSTDRDGGAAGRPGEYGSGIIDPTVSAPTPSNQTSRWQRCQRWLPGLQTLRTYEPAWLRHDLAAGLVLTTMLVPAGIAYAEASGVPGIYGLYATIVEAVDRYVETFDVDWVDWQDRGA